MRYNVRVNYVSENNIKQYIYIYCSHIVYTLYFLLFYLDFYFLLLILENWSELEAILYVADYLKWMINFRVD